MEEDILKKVVIACTSHKGLTPYTMRSVSACPHVAVSMSVGMAEVALARNLQIRDALKLALAQNRSVLLLLDDDIVFTPDDVRTVARVALEHGELVSGVYAVGNFETGDVKISAAPLQKQGYYAVGLGFVAVPVSLLVTQLAEFPLVTWKEEQFRLVTWSGPGPSAPSVQGTPATITWISEDYRLCMRLGGARLLEHVRLGHAKMAPFYPPLDERDPNQLGAPTLEFLAEKLGTTVDNLKIDYEKVPQNNLFLQTRAIVDHLNPTEQALLAKRVGLTVEQLREKYNLEAAK